MPVTWVNNFKAIGQAYPLCTGIPKRVRQRKIKKRKTKGQLGEKTGKKIDTWKGNSEKSSRATESCLVGQGIKIFDGVEKREKLVPSTLFCCLLFFLLLHSFTFFVHAIELNQMKKFTFAARIFQFLLFTQNVTKWDLFTILHLNIELHSLEYAALTNIHRKMKFHRIVLKYFFWTSIFIYFICDYNFNIHCGIEN